MLRTINDSDGRSPERLANPHKAWQHYFLRLEVSPATSAQQRPSAEAKIINPTIPSSSYYKHTIRHPPKPVLSIPKPWTLNSKP